MRRQQVNSENPKVVLLGKGKSHISDEMYELLTSIEPSYIPAHLVDNVFVTLEDDDKYRVDRKYYADGIHYNNFDDQLTKMGMKDVKLVEIILNLDKTNNTVTEDTATLLNRWFDESDS